MTAKFELSSDGPQYQASSSPSSLVKLLLALLALNMAAVIVLAVFLGMGATGDTTLTCKIDGAALASGSLGKGSPSIPAVKGHQDVEEGAAPEVCITKECVTAASNLVLSLDESINPCQDFYKFACGGWIDNHELPEEKSSYSTFTVTEDDNNLVLKRLLGAPVQDDEKDYIKKAKDMYASCLNYDQVNALGAQPMKDFVQDLGGWPLVSPDWTEENFSLSDLLLKVTRSNELPIVNLYVGTDVMNTTKKILEFDQPSFALPGPKYYLGGDDNVKFIKAYKTFIHDVGELMGFVNETTANDDVDAIVEFETKLANISDRPEDRRDAYAMYHPMSLGDIIGNYSLPVFNMSNYVLEMMALPGIDVYDITEEEIVNVKSPAYYSKMLQLVNNTSARTLANYAVWRAVFDNVGTLGADFREAFVAYKRVIFGQQADFSRPDLCVSYTGRNLGFAVGRMFLDAKFSKDDRASAEEMIKNIQQAFNDHLADLDWMDETTKKAAREKNEYINRRIGYPDSNLNDTYLSDIYALASINRTSFLKNVVSCKTLRFAQDASGFRTPTDKTRWSDPPQTVNAYYSPSTNQITFPAGVLQPPNFNSRFPGYINYGAIGSIIGHEITHGFDDAGRQRDKYGKLREWWSPEVVEKFKTRAKCIVDQYTNFSQRIDGHDYHLNGVTSQGENIADNGGVKIAYKAYRTWVSSQGKPEPGLPGLNYTDNQLFFINFAQVSG
ncbi:neprilysin-1 [Aplysia californica]|uniref:Neprilysin-1 n=1 Tax=Aplysia californica TaxID=6500 RepID=A0ABM1A223_APLCA|nr:neprilysin-1 [Aplysia californica]